MRENDLKLKRFGRQLQLFRKQLMLSRENLGRKTGLTVEDIEDLEAGTGNPALRVIYLLAEALNVSPAELIHLQSGYDREYIAYRFHLFQLINNMSKDDIKKTIRNLELT